MPHSELSERNFKRITLINWSLFFPLLVMFGWPLLYLGSYLQISPFYTYPASVLFAVPFMITILHGHVTMALGSAHRHHYYNWLADHPYSFGLLFNEILIKTRFRLAVLAVSLLILLVGYFQ